MTLPPLPLRVPAYPGETVDSFAHRAAAANHTTITDIEAGLRQQRLLTSRARSHHQRATLWRELGHLPPHAFTTPATLNGHPVPARPLCRHCAGGEAVLARLPQFGLICLHHQCTHRRTARSQTYPDSCTQSAASDHCTEPAHSCWTPPLWASPATPHGWPTPRGPPRITTARPSDYRRS